MRHRVSGKQLSIKADHRRAMLRNLAAGLFEHGQIETTVAKAKAVQPFVEKLITTARKRSLAARRTLNARLTDRNVFVWIAEGNVKDPQKLTSDFWDLPKEDEIVFDESGELKRAPRLVEHLIKRVAPLFEGRAGGYTRIVRLGKHRQGDASDLVLLQLVGRESGSQVSGASSRRRTKADNRTKFAAARRKAKPAAA
ncbi:MAG: 50S ribosomal protein L17 [Phycisphaerales bacterium]|jgi:large subunit ribosomal protein L17